MVVAAHRTFPNVHVLKAPEHTVNPGTEKPEHPHTHCTGKPQPGWAGCFSKQKRQHTRDVQEDGQILSEHGEAQGCKIYLFPERRLGFQRLTYLFCCNEELSGLFKARDD